MVDETIIGYDMKDDKIVKYGQIFTRPDMVQFMISLIEDNGGRKLEPSAGTGNFYRPLVDIFGVDNVVGVELDSEICPTGCLNCDFFSLGANDKYGTIIGNPPYVKYTDILPETRKYISSIPLNGLSNLYLYFIWRCLDMLSDGGELILVVPRDFIKTTSARPLNKRLFAEGGFTLFKEFGDEGVFDNASPNVVIFRWVKGRKHTIQISENNGFLSFSSQSGITVGEVFDVYVGGVSGNNKKYYSNAGNIELIVSTTVRDGKTQKAIYDNPNEWIRRPRKIEGKKIFVNSKTRNMTPFYIHDCCYFDGSVLCLRLKDERYDLKELCRLLNENDWDRQGFKVGGRLMFGQRNIQNATIKGLKPITLEQ